MQRKLFAAIAGGRSAASLKNTYLERYGMPARMFNAVRVSLDGKVSAVRESQQSFLQRLARSLPVGVITPAHNCSVLPQTASLELTCADAVKDPSRWCGLAVKVAAPATDGTYHLCGIAITVDGARMGVAGANGSIGVGLLVEVPLRYDWRCTLSGRIAPAAPDPAISI